MAKGSSSVDVFVQRVRLALRDGDIDGAIAACDEQRGSVANVVKSGLVKYREVDSNPEADKENSREAIQKELEEATTLELPMLERNLPIIATIASVGVLVGLFGTVMGMIKAFSALATAGAPDATALATGISEALVNTAIGIGTSALAIVFYNFFTVQIDSLTYQIDEAGYSIVQTYETTH
jgi:biopolymer transport protein ExbB